MQTGYVSAMPDVHLGKGVTVCTTRLRIADVRHVQNAQGHVHKMRSASERLLTCNLNVLYLRCVSISHSGGP